MFAAAARGYGAELFDGPQDPDGSEAFLNNADLADGFQTSASSADGAALNEEDVELMSDGAGMTNEEYGKARQQAKKASGVSNFPPNWYQLPVALTSANDVVSCELSRFESASSSGCFRGSEH